MCVADVTRGCARPNDRDATHHGFVGDLDQAFGAARDRPYGVHAARIAVPAVEDQGHVDIDDVAVLERLLARDAVADHVIDRGAGRFSVAAIHQGRRHRLVVHGEFEHQAVDAVGRHAGLDLVGEHVEAFGGQAAGQAHAREGAGAVQLDLTGLALRRQGRVHIAHGLTSLARIAAVGRTAPAAAPLFWLQCKQDGRRCKHIALAI